MNRTRTMASVAVAGVILAGLMAARPARAHCDGGPDHEGMQAEFAAAEQAAFTQADSNGDGKLTAEEFANFHDLVRKQMEARHFQMLDTDGDGALTLQELQADHHGGPPCGGPDN